MSEHSTPTLLPRRISQQGAPPRVPNQLQRRHQRPNVEIMQRVLDGLKRLPAAPP